MIVFKASVLIADKGVLLLGPSIQFPSLPRLPGPTSLLYAAAVFVAGNGYAVAAAVFLLDARTQRRILGPAEGCAFALAVCTTIGLWHMSAFTHHALNVPLFEAAVLMFGSAVCGLAYVVVPVGLVCSGVWLVLHLLWLLRWLAPPLLCAVPILLGASIYREKNRRGLPLKHLLREKMYTVRYGRPCDPLGGELK